MALKSFSPGINTSFSSQLNANTNAVLAIECQNHVRTLIDRSTIYGKDLTDIWGEAYTDSSGRNDSVNSSTTAFITNGIALHNINLVSSLVYDSVSLSYSAQDTSAVAMFMSKDGTHLYMQGATGDKVYEYSLSTPYLLSTASYTTRNISVSAYASSGASITFSDDGAKMYLLPGYIDSVEVFTLSTPWNISTVTHTATVNLPNTVSGLKFNTAGTKMFVTVGGTPDSLREYILSTPWDISTLTLSAEYSVVGADIIDAFDISDDGHTVILQNYVGGVATYYQLFLPTPFRLHNVIQLSQVFTHPTASDSTVSLCLRDTFSNKMFIHLKSAKTTYAYTINKFVTSALVDTLIYHTIPTGTFSSTIKSAYFKTLVANTETGASIQYKLTNASEDSGYANDGELLSFNAFTSEPTQLVLTLSCNSTTSNYEYPTIYGVAGIAL